MRYLVLSFIVSAHLFGSDVVDFFNASPDNLLMCKTTQYVYKTISQSNAEVITIHGHTFFKMKGENFYILKTGCHALDGKREPIIF